MFSETHNELFEALSWHEEIIRELDVPVIADFTHEMRLQTFGGSSLARTFYCPNR